MKSNIIINIARQMSSFGGITANRLVGGITRGNIDALAKGWRSSNNESIKTTSKTGTTTKTAEQSRTVGMQNSGHQQQTNRIQHFAPALLFSAITNHILFGEAKQ